MLTLAKLLSPKFHGAGKFQGCYSLDFESGVKSITARVLGYRFLGIEQPPLFLRILADFELQFGDHNGATHICMNFYSPQKGQRLLVSTIDRLLVAYSKIRRLRLMLLTFYRIAAT